MSALNDWLDTLPRTRVGREGREWPVYRAAGVAGFYAALIMAFAGAFITDRSFLVTGAVSAVCGVSFFAYAALRALLTRRETLVLLEYLWFALAAAAALLYALREPVLSYLDLAAPALCVFLAVGRVGCTLAGCCYGVPASLGVKYGEAHSRDGFPHHLVGVRLFPVPAWEAIGLAAIGGAAFIALPWARPGSVLAWFLLAYAVMRFGLEGLRGDARPHWLGLSVPRWMCIVQASAVLGWDARAPLIERFCLALGGLFALAAALLWKHRGSMRRKLLTPDHVAELKSIVQSGLTGTLRPAAAPHVSLTSCGVSVAISGAARRDWAHTSIALPATAGDLALLCEVAVQVLPPFDGSGCRYTSGRVLHVPVFLRAEAGFPAVTTQQLYGSLVRQLQKELKACDLEAEPDVWAVPPASSAWYFHDHPA